LKTEFKNPQKYRYIHKAFAFTFAQKNCKLRKKIMKREKGSNLISWRVPLRE
jgi:hypothetical protein